MLGELFGVVVAQKEAHEAIDELLSFRLVETVEKDRPFQENVRREQLSRKDI